MRLTVLHIWFSSEVRFDHATICSFLSPGIATVEALLVTVSVWSCVLNKLPSVCIGRFYHSISAEMRLHVCGLPCFKNLIRPDNCLVCGQHYAALCCHLDICLADFNCCGFTSLVLSAFHQIDFVFNSILFSPKLSTCPYTQGNQIH